jgi:hypothetical protein
MVLAGKLHIIHMDGRARAPACGECYMDRFQGVGLHSPLLEPDLDSEEMGLKFLVSTAGSLSVAKTAVSSANVAMVVVGEDGRSAVYIRYNNGPRTLPWCTTAWIGDKVW